MSKTLRQTLDEIVIYDGEDGEWTLGELEPDASWDIRKTITDYLESLKRPVAKKLVFGDVKSVDNAAFNAAVDQLVMDIEEGKL